MKKTPQHTLFFSKDGAGLTAILLFMVVTGLFIFLGTWSPNLYILATYEDLPGEWAQFLFFLATLGICLLLIRKPHQHRLFFGILGLACFYVIGEEISWGQRLFSFTTPDFFERHNLQQEINLHNFLTGPTATVQKKLIEIGLIAGLLGYGLLYPVLYRQGQKWAHFIHNKGVPVPPLYLSPYFTIAALCEGRILSFNEAEIAELLVAMALVFLSLHYYTSEKNRTSGPEMPLTMLSLVLLVISGATLISWYSWQTPALHTGMEKRITAGQKKFAKRYIRLNQWHHATTLYEQLHHKQPKNSGITRQLALCYAKQGQETLAQVAIQKAIHLDMKRYGRNPIQVATNLSLFKSYQQIGNRDSAEFHLRKALEISHDQVTLAPYNASSFYWYGKALQARGLHATARKQFGTALAMKPHSRKYQEAYSKSHLATVDKLNILIKYDLLH